MTKHFFGDTAVLLGRSLRHITRSLDTIITTTIMPIAFLLLFVYVFGGAINSGSDSYVNYLLPGILLITIASGISYTAFRLFLDMKSGIFERFQSMPIARSSVLWAHVLTSLVANLISLVVVVLVALLMGFRSGAGVLAWLAVAGILILFTLALTWIAVIPGLSAKSADGSAQLLDADQVARGIAEGAVADPVRLLGRLLDDLGVAGLQPLEGADEVGGGQVDAGVGALGHHLGDGAALVVGDAGGGGRRIQDDGRAGLVGRADRDPVHPAVFDVVADLEAEGVAVEGQGGVRVVVREEARENGEVHGGHASCGS